MDLVKRLLAKDAAGRPADAAALRVELAKLEGVAEPVQAATAVGPELRTTTFGESEQHLLSVVLAALPGDETALDPTLRGKDLLEKEERESLLHALAGLGVSPEFLANGALFLTVPSLSSAQDQATQAGRAALLIKARWPAAVVSLATGRGTLKGRTAIGEAVEQAARILQTGSRTPTTAAPSGVFVDTLSAQLLAGRFEQTPQPDGALLLAEEKEADASRLLIGKPTPCVGRESELAMLEAQLRGCEEESQARAVLVSAPPGTGKSRLRHEFLRRVEKRGAEVKIFAGRGDLTSAGIPYLWKRHQPQEIVLKGLSKKACERLVQQVLGREVPAEAVARLVDQAAGNALYLEELIRGLAEGAHNGAAEAPQTVVAMLQARIGALAAGSRRAIRAAAIFGQTFWLGGVAALLGLRRDDALLQGWLAQLVDAEIIEPHPDSRAAPETGTEKDNKETEKQYGFRHALVRDAAYALLTEADRVTGHRTAAQYLEASGGCDLATLAEHYRLGGERERAVTLFRRAGDEVARFGAFATARAHYSRALADIDQILASDAAARLKADLLLRLVQTSLLVAPPAQNLERLETARRAVASLSEQREPPREDRLRLACADYLCGQVTYYAGEPGQAMPFHERALAVVQELGDRELIPVPAYVLGPALVLLGRMRQARPMLAQALGPLQARGAVYDWIRASLLYAWTTVSLGDYASALRELESAREQARQHSQPALVGLSDTFNVCLCFFATDWPAALSAAQRALKTLGQIGDQAYTTTVLGISAWVKSFLGQHEEAAAGFTQRKQIVATFGGKSLAADWFDIAEAEIALHAGRAREALELAQAMAPAFGSSRRFMSQGIAERVWGGALARMGADPAEYARHFAISIAAFEDGGHLFHRDLTHRLGASLGAVAKDPQR